MLIQTKLSIDILFNQVYNIEENMVFVQLVAVLALFSGASATPLDTAVEISKSPVSRNDAGSFSKIY